MKRYWKGENLTFASNFIGHIWSSPTFIFERQVEELKYTGERIIKCMGYRVIYLYLGLGAQPTDVYLTHLSHSLSL